jgi:ferrochelatase
LIAGVLLAQVGTPEAPTARAVGRYLARFLSDRRVVDYPAWWWRPLLRGVIVPLRARRSARLYQRIWTSAGSPLLVESEKQRQKLQAALGAAYRVALGMAYAGPSFDAAVDDLLAAGASTIIVLPMFPQYSSATTASVYDAVFASVTDRAGKARTFVPAVISVPPYFLDPSYISALRRRITSATSEGAQDHFVLTFHGLPERYITNGDPYRTHCEQTVTALAAAMGWSGRDYTVAYQSRFGPERWIGPSTADTLQGLYARGIRRPLVIAPGFTTDCLETLDELGHEGREQFVAGGGDAANYRLCPCLNDLDEWIATMAALVRSALPTKP